MARHLLGNFLGLWVHLCLPFQIIRDTRVLHLQFADVDVIKQFDVLDVHLFGTFRR